MATCKFEGCAADAKSLGYCIYHYWICRRNGTFERIPKCPGGSGGCTKPGDYFKGFCRQHAEDFVHDCRMNGSFSSANEREYELLPDKVPNRPKWEYEPNAELIVEEAKDAEA